jgi:thiol-disulfide isomerase/thioredoxin
VIQTTCVYCLLIFALIVLLNVIYGRHQLLLGTPVFLAGIIAFSSLNFSSAQILIQAQNLESGTFAVKRHDNQAEPLFLFFSSDCPHCRNVLDTLDGDNNCQISFNPIDRIDSLDVPGIEYFPNYNPTINRLLLSLLDIKTIPVLLDKNGKGLTFIKGEEAIVDFINKTCFDKQLPPQAGSSSYNAPIGFSAFPAPEGECEIEVECPDLVEGQSTSDAN